MAIGVTCGEMGEGGKEARRWGSGADNVEEGERPELQVTAGGRKARKKTLGRERERERKTLGSIRITFDK